MKIVTLVPVKNEGWILNYSLKNYSSFSDYIIIADQNSSDDTLQICSKFEKVKIINNPYTSHTNQIRWLLLDEARKIEGDKIIVYLDADELLSPKAINEMRAAANLNQKIAFRSQWVQLINSYDEYRVDGVWKNNYKQFAFIDNESVNYNRNLITNDHSNRIPEIENLVTLEYPILHLQYLARSRSQVKQAYYMCSDLIKNNNPRKINNQYKVAKLTPQIKAEKSLKDWYSLIDLPPLDIFIPNDNIKMSQIYSLFKERGVKFFEALDIWHIKELEDYFILNVGRKPKIKVFPEFIIKANDIKNKIKMLYFQ